ncbi:SusC/RagA family TonB-linked outer membrane protein [Desertivirga xinjiangensis]|uniref:SusC/RagA family TonB-linked outer membrane protein n=1 Tax=Desertivirga xinjiangensis TaxID=539206 RepID=UPI00210C163C|nr:TonB-dependent receptor [Pedobacter xinjiangensis]
MKNFVFLKRKSCLLVFLFSCSCLITYAQQTVTGKVVDAATNESIIGASVKVKNGSSGASTDVNGVFTLSAQSGAQLEVSYIGYASVTVTADVTKPMVVRLDVNNKQLQEVVVVGYGTQKKETLTGAVTQVGEEVFENKTFANPALSLQGEVPGLVITRSSSRAGNEGLNIRLRGESSVTGVDPLIIIDGVPVIGTWELNQINPDDIATVSVLKDASAAIYGARAAGGVILVTTKRGKGGKLQVNYNNNLSLNTIGITVPYATMSEWAQLYLETSTQDKVDVNGNVVEWFPQWGKDNITRMANGESFEFTNPSNGNISKYENNNWFDQLYGPSYSQKHNISLRGSSEDAAYNVSFGFADNKSLLKTAYDGEKKYNARLNYDYNITSKIKLQTGLSYDDRTVSNPKNGIGAGFFDAPVFPTYNANGDFYDDYGYRNPVASTQRGGRVNNKEEIFRVNTRLSAELFKDFSLSGTAAITRRNGWKSSYNQTYNLYNWKGDRLTSTQYPNPEVIENIYNTFYQNYGLFVDYKKTVAKFHNFSVTGGVTGELNENKEVEAKRTKLEFEGLYDLNTANPVTQTNKGGSNHWGLLSYISRLNYDYKGKYLLELIGRRDGSSKFAADQRWSNFAGITAGWRISEESFLKNLGIFNDLKIRGGYGETGGQANIGNYDYISNVTTTGTAIFGTTPAYQGTAYLAGTTSRTRTWERIANSNIGLDFAVLRNRLSGSFDLFQKKNIGMLIDVTYPQVYGATAPKSNSGELTVKGWELLLNWRDRINTVTYNIGFNIGDNKSDLTSMVGRDSWTAGKVALREGYPLNSLFVYKTDGLFKDQADVDAYYAQYTSVKAGNLGRMVGDTKVLRPGDAKVVDLDGNGYIDPVGDGSLGQGDVYYYGDANPHYTFGLNLGAQWKNFDLSTFFQGVGQQYVLRGGNARAPFFRNYLNVNASYIGTTWTPENMNAENPRLSFDTDRNNWNWQFNDINVQNLSYVRLKTLVLGYTLPQNISRKLKSNRIRFYFSGTDLFEFSTINDGFDPEQGESADSTYPFQRTYSVGLDFTF